RGPQPPRRGGADPAVLHLADRAHAQSRLRGQFPLGEPAPAALHTDLRTVVTHRAPPLRCPPPATWPSRRFSCVEHHRVVCRSSGRCGETQVRALLSVFTETTV